MDRLLQFQDPQCHRSYIREHQAHIVPDQKIFILIFSISFFYTIFDAVYYIAAKDKDVSYLAIMLAVVFQFMRIVLFIFYIKHSADPTPRKFLFVEKIFLIMFSAAIIATWNVQISLDSSRIYVVGMEAGWTFLYVNTLFGQWPWKLIVYLSAAVFTLVRQVINEDGFSLGTIQAIFHMVLILLTGYIDEKQKKQRLLKGISVEKTEQTLKSILNNLPENIAVLNLEGELVFFNEYLDVSFNISQGTNSIDFFQNIYQIKPRERHVNLQKIQERYNFVKPPIRKTVKTIAKRLKRLATNTKQSPANNHLRRYLTEEFNLSNQRNSILLPNHLKPRRSQFTALEPSKTLTEFFASIKYFKDLQEVLDFFCVNVDILRNYAQKERNFFIFDGKYNTSDGMVKSFEIKLALSSFNAEESFIIILRDTTHRDIIVTLEDNNNFKDSLLSSISHELRTPLNTNLNMLELAINHYQTTDITNIKGTDRSHHHFERDTGVYHIKEEYLVPAHKSGKVLESVINDVLDYSMLLARKFVINIKDNYLLKSLDKIRYLCEFQAQKRNIEFHISLSQKLNYVVGTDHRRLRQILTNLLNNAIRFTNKGFVSLRIEPHHENPDLIQFIVKDSGIGIPKEALDRMTNMLDKGNVLNKLSKEASGVGMGLTISHLLAKELGPTSGRLSGIKIESTAGQGSKFWFVVENWARTGDTPVRRSPDKSSFKHSKSIYGNENFSNMIARSHNERTSKVGESPSGHENLEDSVVRPKSRKEIGSLKVIRTETNINLAQPEHEAILRKEDEVDDDIALMIKDDNLRLSMSENKLLKSDSKFPLIPGSQGHSRLMVNGSEYPSAILTADKKEKGQFPFPASFIHTLDVVRSQSAGNTKRKLSADSAQKDCLCAEILVVDDDMFNQFTMENLLGSLGFKIAKANNGEDSIKVVKRRSELKCSAQCLPFKIIFMDLSMPIMDGFQATIALKELMKDGVVAEIPIVACTAFVDQDKTEKCYEVGMEGRISKPVNKNKLREVLKKYGIIQQD